MIHVGVVKSFRATNYGYSDFWELFDGPDELRSRAAQLICNRQPTASVRNALQNWKNPNQLKPAFLRFQQSLSQNVAQSPPWLF